MLIIIIQVLIYIYTSGQFLEFVTKVLIPAFYRRLKLKCEWHSLQSACEVDAARTAKDEAVMS
jgi:hypothetical protein